MLASASPFAHELQALKTELQATLARLCQPSSSSVCASWPVTTSGANDAQLWRHQPHPSSPWSHTSTGTSTSPVTTVTNTNTTTTTTTTPTTVRSEPVADSDNAARLMRELVATARRRRQVETQLARDLERDEDEEPYDQQRVHRNGSPTRVTRDRAAATAAAVEHQKERLMQQEIESLRSHRKRILHQIDEEFKMDGLQEGSHTADKNKPKPSMCCSCEAGGTEPTVADPRPNENEYSIEGVVKLALLQGGGSTRKEPHQSEQAQPVGAPMVASERPNRPPPHQATHTGLQPFHLNYGYPHHHTHDTMQDVFSIQLKFAETMLQLDKSIQMRDRLLVSRGSSSSAGLSTLRRRSRRHAPSQRRSRPPPTIHEEIERDPADSSNSNNNSSGDDEVGVAHRLGDSSGSASMSDDTTRLWRRYRLDSRQQQHTTPAAMTTTATARSTPSSGSVVTTTTTSTSPGSHTSPAAPPPLNANADELPCDDNLHTPNTNESSSANKQVRFHDAVSKDDEYPTPQIARNLSFDSTDDDQPTTSTITTTMTKARFRPTATTATTVKHQEPTKPSSGPFDEDEALSFMDESSVCSADLNDESFLTAFQALRCELRKEGKPTFHALPLPDQTAPTDPPSGIQSVASSAQPLDLAALKQQKREVALDIQELTAKLVLSSNAAKQIHMRATIDSLRRTLHEIENHESRHTANADCGSSRPVPVA